MAVVCAQVRENILLEAEFDSKRYEATVKACQLERDFALFPQGLLCSAPPLSLDIAD